MKNIDVFIIEPDLTLSRRLSELIKAEDQTSMVGLLQGNYRDTIITQLRKIAPDVLLLGINGIDTKEMELFHKFREEYPALPIIVMPKHNREGAKIALAALKNGAVEYINKTKSQTGTLHTREHFSKWLIPVIKAIPRINKKILTSGNNTDKAISEIKELSSLHFEKSSSHMKFLTILGCLGGVPALYSLLPTLPEKLPVPIIVVQHMPKIFTEVFAKDLNRITRLNVQEATDGSELKAGKVYIAPGGYHSTVENNGDHNVISLNQGINNKKYRPSIDVLLKSIRYVFKNKVLLVYLSGGGNDGIEGAKVIDTVQGQIIIQNRQTSLLWDLPLKIDVHGIEEGKYPLELLGNQITQRLI